MSVFCERLRETRKAASLTQAMLSAKSGLQLRQYVRYETGEQLPTLPRILAIANALEVSLDYLAGRTDKPEVNQ